MKRSNRRHGHAKRKYGAVRDAHGRRRKLRAWQVYRGFTLDPYKGPVVEHSSATWEVKVHKGSGPGSMVGNAYGKSEAEAFEKARRLVDAMHGD